MYGGLLLMIVLGLLYVMTLRALATVGAQSKDIVTLPFQSGYEPSEHALSRYHVRWYTASIVFLAFDVEMLFMYPWTLVVSQVGVSAVVEMFLFLGALLAAVLWAKREGAFRWA